MASHAAYPTPLVLRGDRVRVYFSSRDTNNRSSIAALDLGLSADRFEIVSPPRGPLLSPGPRGAFDDSGVTIGSVLAEEDTVLVWYLGWNLGVTVPFRNAIGLATGQPDGELKRRSPGPVLDRSAADPYTLSYPWVLRGADGFRMWYGSHLEWGAEGRTMRHAIKEAISTDGAHWQEGGIPVLSPAGGEEFAVSRPCVIKEAGGYRMWYSRRFETYRLGYAERTEGGAWTRRDNVLRFVGPPGEWEGDTMAYPAVFDCAGRRYMLYNGGGYGRTGFGLAILEQEEAG